MNWRHLLASIRSPCCGQVGGFLRHAWYRKYHYSGQVRILRVRCVGCGRTHALMPSFSLPGTSMGTEEAEGYLMGRTQGLSRANAGRALLEQGMGVRCLKALERKLEVAVNRGKAALAGRVDGQLEGLRWIEALCGPTTRPLFALNQAALRSGMNALCFCRASILIYRRDREKYARSHKQESAGGG